ncbi:MAG: hypothetical protein QM736_19575 [Vicinamibacterales bacterium]
MVREVKARHHASVTRRLDARSSGSGDNDAGTTHRRRNRLARKPVVLRKSDGPIVSEQTPMRW